MGKPGAFVLDAEAAGSLFLEIGILELVRRQLSDAKPPAGMRPTAEGVSILLELASAQLGRQGNLELFVTMTPYSPSWSVICSASRLAI